MRTLDVFNDLPDRGSLMQFLGAQIDRCRSGNWPLALIVLDIGYPEGQALPDEATRANILRSMVRLLAASLRASDPIFRLGKTEFAVALPGLNEIEALGMAARLREAVEIQPTHGAREIPAHAPQPCMGIAIFPPHGQAAEPLLANALQALAQAKQLGLPWAVSVEGSC